MDLAGYIIYILDFRIELLLIVIHIMRGGSQFFHRGRHVHDRIVDGFGHFPQPVFIVAHLRKGVRHKIQHLGRSFQVLLGNIFDLAHRFDILVRIDTDLRGNLAILVLLQGLSQHLTADD